MEKHVTHFNINFKQKTIFLNFFLTFFGIFSILPSTQTSKVIFFTLSHGLEQLGYAHTFTGLVVSREVK